MGIPRWFESTFQEAREANRSVDFAHLGEQFGLRIEEVVPTSSLSGKSNEAGGRISGRGSAVAT